MCQLSECPRASTLALISSSGPLPAPVSPSAYHSSPRPLCPSPMVLKCQGVWPVAEWEAPPPHPDPRPGTMRMNFPEGSRSPFQRGTHLRISQALRCGLPLIPPLQINPSWAHALLSPPLLWALLPRTWRSPGDGPPALRPQRAGRLMLDTHRRAWSRGPLSWRTGGWLDHPPVDQEASVLPPARDRCQGCTEPYQVPVASPPAACS